MATSKPVGRLRRRARNFPAAQPFCAVADIGHATSFFRPTARKCISQLARARMTPITPLKQIARAFSNSTPMAVDKKFMHGEFETLWGSHFVRGVTNSG